MSRDELINEYFDWLCASIGGDRQPDRISYKKLLIHLHNTNFRYTISRDKNMADDGIALRYRFSLLDTCDEPSDWVIDILSGPCSVLEMLVALALRCEETIMDDSLVGDRTGQWFWGMITNLGLGAMYDSRFDKKYVTQTIRRFLDRDYEPNGKGGLFTIRDCDCDLRTVDIWRQLCWYLDIIVGEA